MPTATQLSQLPTKFGGLRYVAFKSQVLVSTGIVSMDSILGGGIPLGTVLLIEEDEYGVFSEVLMRYYYAEGLASKQAVFLASPDNQFRNLVYRLPQVAKSEENEVEEESPGDFKMKIAWRYQGNSEACSKPSTTSLPPNFGHNFDLLSFVPPAEVDAADITLCPKDIDDSSSYEELLKHFNEAATNREGPIRFGVHCLGSPCWSGENSSLSSFLYALRCLVHNNYCSVAVVTVSPQLIKNEALLKRCEDICDTVISLESLVNNSNPIYAEYKALVNILKYPSINSLSAYRPEANDWALKLHRRKCYIEKLHIPAEVGDKKESSSIQSSPLCHRPAANIDF